MESEFSYSVAHAENYNLADAEKIIGDDVSNDGFSTKLIKSYADLVSYSTTSELPFYDTGSSEYDSTLSQQVRTYDSTYFEENALVLVSAYKQSNKYVETLNVDIVDDTLNIALMVSGYVYDETAVELVDMYLIEVTQIGLEDVKNIEIMAITNGSVYSLDIAYELGFLTAEEVASIVYYFYDGRAYLGEYTEGMTLEIADFVEYDYYPIAKDPNELSEETANAILQTFVDRDNAILEAAGADLDGAMVCEIEASDYEITRYLGTYNEYIAITYTNRFIAGVKSTVKQIADTVVYYAGLAYLPIFIWVAN